MNCSDVTRDIPLYCYGEVPPAVEEAIESHLAGCPTCTAELARHRAFLSALDDRAEIAAAVLLASCRARLRTAVATELATPKASNWSEALRNFWRFDIPFRVPVGALALVALGFVGARVTPERFGGMKASLAEPMFSSIRSVEPDASGRVRISVDDISRRQVSGALGDENIQRLLIEAAREENNPGVRVESIGLLKSNVDSEEVRGALLDALTRDPNPGVRLKALEGLRPYAGNVEVRKTLATVLVTDDNAGVRVQAIDLLTTHRDQSIVGALQNALQFEDNTYVRAQCERLLAEMKASVGTY
ncbi:MAG: putative transrane anti-sigma factor [Bryobacterales bacterium]|nr:putative transrane anti-sigma factor [Bryobacterales bacterium]